jgi:hypothetical protein
VRLEPCVALPLGGWWRWVEVVSGRTETSLIRCMATPLGLVSRSVDLLFLYISLVIIASHCPYSCCRRNGHDHVLSDSDIEVLLLDLKSRHCSPPSRRTILIAFSSVFLVLWFWFWVSSPRRYSFFGTPLAHSSHIT